ncbi:hypothetical protein POX_g08773 [Penicillium oxalicum]|uniref:DUF1917 domain-containing protein n=1 Tax=Penicillium oxalicum (strain 114-2 / CGMCC 5302) TaxID=933388 RepID=S7Z9N9_PENO1|nr:hypothetical protein POX_g08773 [Penicillium oxalicum]EPS26929.1 hypothetical protein PDE_01869 [Penicillium oxalicum 114-2]KAI2786388.1 hypothetical protein POX_g08773 [Penicillium oxalicum]
MSSMSIVEEMFSDESSFYGDEDEKARLEEQVATYDPESYWANVHPRLLSTIQYTSSAPSTKPEPTNSALDDHDVEALTSCPRDSRGRGESSAAFLSRLSPSRTRASDIGPWIWMRESCSHGGEGDVATFVREGTALLRAYEEEASELREAHEKSGAKTKAALTRKLNPLRRTLEQDIFKLARETGVTAGKWMLFPSVDSVDSVWKTVVSAWDEGELGDAAKVATDDGSGQARLICVYTDDFSDRKDVKRVLNALVARGLVDKKSRPIYYKCDAYTYLDIKSNNDYGLKASLFSSHDVLAGKV